MPLFELTKATERHPKLKGAFESSVGLSVGSLGHISHMESLNRYGVTGKDGFLGSLVGPLRSLIGSVESLVALLGGLMIGSMRSLPSSGIIAMHWWTLVSRNGYVLARHKTKILILGGTLKRLHL